METRCIDTRRFIFFAPALLFVLCFLPGTGECQYIPMGAIKVMLYERTSHEPITAADVFALDKKKNRYPSNLINEDGETFIKPLAPGFYTVVAQGAGYSKYVMLKVKVTEGKTSYITAPLVRTDSTNVSDTATYIIPVLPKN